MDEPRFTVLVATTGHWAGDPRLNRHVRYLEEANVTARVEAYKSTSRWSRLANVIRVGVAVWKERPDAVILPDPELFVIGALVARIRGIKAVADIHEDYSRAAHGRKWIPGWLKPIIAASARVNDWLARRSAHVVVVAAPELSDGDSVLVMNTPNPDDFTMPDETLDPPTVAYVGDVTEARGALSIAELARRMPNVRFLVIGKATVGLAQQMTEIGGDGQIELVGRLPHSQAWEAARGAVAGLSLLIPVPAYREAVATKLWEYCAAGVPPIVSDLPGQRAFVARIDDSLVVEDLDDAVRVITRLMEDPAWALDMARRSRREAEKAWAETRPDLALQRAVVPRPITWRDDPISEN
jgi:glycosyltransferase involved in cell wall biosynthesis